MSILLDSFNIFHAIKETFYLFFLEIQETCIFENENNQNIIVDFHQAAIESGLTAIYHPC